MGKEGVFMWSQRPTDQTQAEEELELDDEGSLFR